MSQTLRPFTTSPVLSPRPWGGRRLVEYGKELPDDTSIGESWEVADLPDDVVPYLDDPRSRVASGPFVGLSLGDLIASQRAELLGPVEPTAEGRFPLLVKLLDASEHLSVQVHPHQGYVATHSEARLKTESWYVIEADPGAVMFYGFSDGWGEREVKARIGTPDIVPTLRTFQPESGSFYNVPAGLVHSLGAGLLVAEIQTPSDTTYRLYDWSMEYGREPREMHLQQGAASILLDPADATSLPPAQERGVRELISNPHYWIREHRTHEAIRLADRPGPRVMMVIRGSVAIDQLVLGRGGTAIVPAGALDSTVAATSPSTVLEIGIGT
ncbi:MAG: class I mannose-6-phosphate isomerase [Acidimicrobiia bacterium]|nr:class I mannose-6-phosphate isomerase [Acidimicrobiia bacterium]